MPATGLSLRRWATPLVIGATLLMSVTGVLMFFELDVGLVTVTHQWLSWAFLLGVGAHIALNWRPLRNHLKSGWGRTSVATFAALMVAALFSWGMITGPQIKRPIEEALVDAPIAALAAVKRNSAEVVLSRLAANGIVASGDDSLRDVALSSGVDENRLLAIVFFLN